MRAIVVSNVCFYREGIARALREDGIATTAVDNAARGLADLCAQADVVLVDLLGDDLAQTLAIVAGRLPVVGLGLTAAPPVAAAAALGVRAFVGCDQTVADLLHTIRAAARGEAVCPASIAAALFAGLGAGEGPVSALPIESLTRREQEIGRLVMRGFSNKEIASQLVIEPTTVKNHVHQILRKLDVRRRGQAADILRDVWTERSDPLRKTVRAAVDLR